MKGGKGGQGRKRGPARPVAKGKPHAGGKHVGKQGKREFPEKLEKTTTRLGANRTPDDA